MTLKKATRAKRAPKKTAPDPDWLRARRSILLGIKKQVGSRLGDEPPEIKRAKLKLEREFRQSWQISSKAKLLRDLAKADVIFCADFHAFPQAQRTHLKIIKERVGSSKRRLCLGLEAFPVSAQKHLNDFLLGSIDEKELLKKSRWKEDWGFPWENYKGLVEYAKNNGHDVIALGERKRSATLSEREIAAAKVIETYLGQCVKECPQVYVIFGELHLSESYLPKKLVHLGLKFATVHLNAENVYFDLAEQGLENRVDVVQYANSRYCILASPPWVQWQSYLLYLDNALDLEGIDGDEDWEADLSALLVSLIELATHDLKVEIRANDLAVYYAGNPQFYNQLKKRLTSAELSVARMLITSNRSFFVPKGALFYLTRTTINQVAELAGQYIHARVSGRSEALLKMPKDFEARIWIEAVGFFVSKLINHKRHSETLPDLQAKLAGLAGRDQSRAALMLALDQRYRELFFFHTGRRKPTRIKARSPGPRFEAARILGGMMGERLYLAVRSRSIKLDTALSWMRKNPKDADFATFYEDVVVRLGPGTGALRTRKERL